MDYVFDWARDSFRPDILAQLRSLASGENDAASVLYADTDIYSTLPEAIEQVSYEQAERQRYLEYISCQKKFASLDTNTCAVRHASFIETRYRCIYITEDNWSTLLQSTTTSETKARLLQEGMVTQSPVPILVHSKTVDDLEYKWTGNRRTSRNGDDLFYTMMSYATFISPSWNLVREVNVLAVAESMFDTVLGVNWDIPTEVDDDGLLVQLERLRAGSTQHVLLSAISRSCFVFPLDNEQLSDESSNNSGTRPGSPQSRDNGGPVTSPRRRRQRRRRRRGKHTMRYRECSSSESSDFDSCSESDDESDGLDDQDGCVCFGDSQDFHIPHFCPGLAGPRWYLRNVVHYIYKLCKKGTMEPEEPFLRLSNRFEQQHNVDSSASPIPPCFDQNLRASDDGYVLVYSAAKFRDSDRSKTNICVYITDKSLTPPTESELKDKVRKAFETRDVYHTKRESDIISFTTAIQNPRNSPWNLQNTYGVYSQGYEFYEFLCPNGSMDNCPRTQGSRRLYEQSGAYIWKRNLYPSLHTDEEEAQHHNFLLYKLLHQEMGYWTTVVETRRALGRLCCRLCAAPMNDANASFCVECHDALHDLNLPEVYITVLRHIKGPIVEDPLATKRFKMVQNAPLPDYILRRPNQGKISLQRYAELILNCAELQMPFTDLKQLITQWRCFQLYASRMRSSVRLFDRDASGKECGQD